MPSAALPPPAGRFRAHVGDHTYELHFEDGRLTLDGEAVDYTFAPLDGRHFSLLVEGRSLPVTVEPLAGGQVRVTLAGRQVEVRVKDEKDLLLERYGLEDDADAAEREVHAPMPGLVLKVMVAPGQTVAPGDALVVLEAMKMENELRAASGGTVEKVHVAPGDAVNKNALLIEFET